MKYGVYSMQNHALISASWCFYTRLRDAPPDISMDLGYS